jgi:hypothetical protein
VYDSRERAQQREKAMQIRWLAAITLTLSLTRVADAQSVGRMLESDFKNAGKDMLSIWGSPFDSKGRDWAGVAAALAATGIAMFADQEVADWATEHDTGGVFSSIKEVRRGGKLYTGKYVVPPIAALYIVGIATKNQGLRDAVLGCGASWISGSLSRKALYLVVGRARPDTMPNNPQHWTVPGHSEWQMHSFPAGHLENVMACASFWNNRFDLGIAEPAIWAVAAAVGVGRTLDRGHWFSDHVLGGIAGYAIGREVARRSLAREAARSSATPSVNVSPSPGGVSLNLHWSF